MFVEWVIDICYTGEHLDLFTIVIIIFVLSMISWYECSVDVDIIPEYHDMHQR